MTGLARGDSLYLNLTYYVDCPDGRLLFRSGDLIEAGLRSPTDLTGTRVIRASDVDILLQPVHFQKLDH